MNEQNKPRLNCDIVQDLLPLYHDAVLSASSRQAVEEHLATCPHCQQEYQDLCEELPTEQQTPATQETFRAMMRRLRWKRIGVTILVALLSCGILGGCYAALTRLPMKELTTEDIKIVKAYRYVGEEGTERLFLLHEMPWRSYIATRFVQYGDDPKTMEFAVSVPWLGGDHPEREKRWEVQCWDLLDEMDRAEFRGIPFWTEAENGDDPIPEYVYAYDLYWQGNGGITDWCASEETGLLTAQYADGTRVSWDLDGNVCAD